MQSPARRKTPSLVDLERRQEGLISRLSRLQGQVNTMRKSLGLGDAATATQVLLGLLSRCQCVECSLLINGLYLLSSIPVTSQSSEVTSFPSVDSLTPPFSFHSDLEDSLPAAIDLSPKRQSRLMGQIETLKKTINGLKSVWAADLAAKSAGVICCANSSSF